MHTWSGMCNYTKSELEVSVLFWNSDDPLLIIEQAVIVALQSDGYYFADIFLKHMKT